MKDLFRQFNLLFLVLLSGQIFFYLIVLFIIASVDSSPNPKEESIFNTLIPIFILSMIFAIHLINKQRQRAGMRSNNLNEKFRFYRNSVLLRLILMEATNIFAIVITLLEGKIYYTSYFVIGLMAFFYFRPSMKNFIEEYNLSFEEREIVTKT